MTEPQSPLETPTPLDYQSQPGPPPALTWLDYQKHDDLPRVPPWWQFTGGVLIGGIGSWVWFVFVVIVTYAMSYNSAWAWAAVALGPLGVIGGGLLIARNARRRGFGLGLAASVPLTALTMFVICGH